jgi:hypothetical protein
VQGLLHLLVGGPGVIKVEGQWSRVKELHEGCGLLDFGSVDLHMKDELVGDSFAVPKDCLSL